ncbi:MAG: hypothetical protein HY681_12320, partial [Chloroflexi bacterium]|nr:hypothetical protein [Chloroflexota bacterium]
MLLNSIRRFPIPAAVIVSLLVFAGLGCDGKGTQLTPGPTPTRTQGASTIPAGTEFVMAFASVTIEEKTQARLTRLDIVPRHPVIASGDTLLFSVLAYDEANRPIPGDELAVRWQTTDLQVGFISPTGVFRAGTQRGVFDKAIQVSVTQSLNGRTVTVQDLASVSVIRTLSENDISRVQVLPGVVQLEPRGQMLFTPLAVDRSGVPVPNVVYTWEALDPAAGEIGQDGKFTGGSVEGEYPAALRVVAQKRSDPSQTASAVVSVTIQALGNPQPPSKVNLFPQSLTVRPGDVIDFRALTLDSQGNLVRDVQTEWVLREPRAGDLDGRGRFRAGTLPGTYPAAVEVTVTPQGGASARPLRATATVTVLSPVADAERLQSILLSPQVVRLRPGESRKLTVSTVSNLGEGLTPAQTVWTAEAPELQVTQDGVVTALDRPGAYLDGVNVTVTAGEGEARVVQKVSATVIVLGALDRVNIVPQEVSVSPRQAVQFNVIAYDTNGVRLFDVIAAWEVL